MLAERGIAVSDETIRRWRAVDQEGVGLDILVQARRNGATRRRRRPFCVAWSTGVGTSHG